MYSGEAAWFQMDQRMALLLMSVMCCDSPDDAALLAIGDSACLAQLNCSC